MAEVQAQSLLSSHHRIPRNSSPFWSVEEDNGRQGYKVLEQELHSRPTDSCYSCKGEYVLFISILITSTISLILLIGDRRGWVLSLSLYNSAINNRASTQIVVQLLSHAFAFCQITALCTLINQATRLRFSRTRASINALRFSSHLCTPSMTWRLPFKYFLPLLLFIGLTMTPSALWVGALSPISVFKTHKSILNIPSYENVSLIKEYPAEFGGVPQTAQVRNPKGIFSYGVGITMEGALLSSASSATTVDGSLRKHFKLDNSGFTYIGRSYGVGSSAGLTYTDILSSTTTTYAFQERGYNAKVQCVYNSSATFFLSEYGSALLWEAIGTLPNSNGVKEISTYWGHGDAPAIVAIGVTRVQSNGTKYIGIAAGSNYAFLNMTQCAIDYIPTLFNISVSVIAQNITVVAAATSEDINPKGNITHVSTRQLTLISNDQTNLYQSLLGNSFMGSIGDYNISQANSSNLLTEESSTLTGLTNSVSAVLDDVLVGYASAQLMVGNQSTRTEVVVTDLALKIGQRVYIIAIFAFNLVVVILVFEEAMRTTFWKGLEIWDYMDIEAVIVSSLKGGRKAANSLSDRDGHVMEMTPRYGWRVNKSQNSKEEISGKSWVSLDKDTALVLDTEPERIR